MVALVNFKITTLVENTVAQSGKSLLGEHGLSFYIEAGERRILFDTGQNLAIANNARVLGVDLNRIDAVVLSHGHYDHSGGLQSMLACNPDFTLHAHPDAFSPKVKQENERHKYIGIPVEEEKIISGGVDLRLDKSPVQIAPGLMTTGEIPRANEFEAVESGFFLKAGRGVIADTLADDQALILDTNKGVVVLLGCSHRGVVNTLNHVTHLTGKNSIHALMGGLHLGSASDAKLEMIIDHLRGFGLEKMIVGHCTGPRAFLALSNEFKDRVFQNTVGHVLEF